MAVVPGTRANPGSGRHVLPSIDEYATACAGGCWTPTAINPAGDAPIPRNWFSARKWHGWHW